jgi:1-deoxy-D-xylulose-5-phosphate synthase
MLIDSIKLPEGLRSLSDDELEQVAEELREELIHSVSRSGGHFASSLGVTELSVALHATFHTPQDRVLWDVGHQGYIHKMLTGRREQMHTIRRKDGLSGFLRRDESEYDAFGAGHAGTSISAAVGMALALNREDSERYVIPVIGDGALTAGMAFEALNHAGGLDLKNFIVLLNDNEMSISKNVGALSWFFSRALTGETSTAARKQVKSWYKHGYIPSFLYKAIDKAEESAQSYFSDASVLFDAFGFRYIGPVDGHNVGDLRQALQNAKRQEGPVVVHARTVKGKGYHAAENDPLTWHGVKPFDPKLAQFKKSRKTTNSPTPPSYTEVFSSTLIELCRKDPKVIGITAAMPTGTGLDELQEQLPDQFVDVGICEQHAVTFAAGLACEGYRPVCAIYSTFLQRAYDQVLHDVCIQKLPVVFALDRAGAVGNDGETHQGLFDISYLRSMPNITLLAPKDEEELRHMLHTALQWDGPIAIRYPRGNGVGVPQSTELTPLPIGKGEYLQSGTKIAFLTVGPPAYTALTVASEVEELYGFRPTVANLRTVKPLDRAMLREIADNHDLLVTIEDNALMGGFGSFVLEELSVLEAGRAIPEVLRFGAEDRCTPHATQQEQYELHGYDANSISNALQLRLGAPETYQAQGVRTSTAIG